MISRLIGDWNWDEFTHMQDTMNTMRTQAGAIVDIIYDFSESNDIPFGASRYIQQLLAADSQYPGRTVIVNELPIMSSLINAFIMTYGDPASEPIATTTSLAEAVTYLQIQRIQQQTH